MFGLSGCGLVKFSYSNSLTAIAGKDVLFRTFVLYMLPSRLIRNTMLTLVALRRLDNALLALEGSLCVQ